MASIKLPAVIIVLLLSVACQNDSAEPIAGPAAVLLSSASIAIRVGDTISLQATPVDARGQPLAYNKLDWTTNDSTIAIVDSTGLIYGRSPGVTRISAHVGVTHGTAKVEVSNHESGWRGISIGCGLWSDFSTYCWFWPDQSGQTTVPVQLPGAQEFHLVRSGQGHRCALTTAGAAYCWGSNQAGQLGDGTTADHSMPGGVAGGLTFDSIAVGILHTCGLTHAREIYCWGAGASGQLGIGAVPELCHGIPCSPVPIRVSGNHRFRAVAAGGDDRIGFGAVGRGITCGISELGLAYCWGDNEYGELGDGTHVSRSTPTKVASDLTFESIAVGAAHVCGLSQARVFCWGANDRGQLGTVLPNEPRYHCLSGDILESCTSVPVLVSSNEAFTGVTTNRSHTCSVNRFGAAFCWGSNRFGQVGNGQTTTNYPYGVSNPQRVVGSRTFLELSTGVSTTCGITPDRSAYCWGNGSSMPLRVTDPGA